LSKEFARGVVSEYRARLFSESGKQLGNKQLGNKLPHHFILHNISTREDCSVYIDASTGQGYNDALKLVAIRVPSKHFNNKNMMTGRYSLFLLNI